MYVFVCPLAPVVAKELPFTLICVFLLGGRAGGSGGGGVYLLWKGKRKASEAFMAACKPSVSGARVVSCVLHGDNALRWPLVTYLPGLVFRKDC